MRSATRLALAAFAVVLWSGSAAAQNDVTFQVNLQPFLTSCQFKPATETVFVRGTFQANAAGEGSYSLANPLTDAGNGVYTATIPIAEGPIAYKFYVGKTATPGTEGILGWEDKVPDGGPSENDRDYVVVAGAQTVPVVDFNKPVADNCGTTDIEYDLTFAVDMSIQQSFGRFNPATQNVAVAGGFEEWNTTNAVQLAPESSGNGLYTGTTTTTLAVPDGGGVPTTFKFIIRNNADNSVASWETVNPNVTTETVGGDVNRAVRVTGAESDDDGNGRPDFFYDNDADPATFPFFSDETSEAFLGETATVTFNVDMRPAYYRLADTGALPGVPSSNPTTGNTAIDGVFINGPAAGGANEEDGLATGIADWSGWGAELASRTVRKLAGPNADSVYTITYTYPVGTSRTIVAKFGTNGADDEAIGSTNHYFSIAPGANTFNVQFGCMSGLNGRFTDDEGTAPYDEYLIFDNTATPPTCRVVRSGGSGDVVVASESGPQIAGLTVSSAYPNPLRGAGKVDFTLDRAMTVSARVYDVTGRQVATLLDGRSVSAGKTTVDFDASRFAAGLYVLRVEADGQVVSRRMTVTR